MEKPAFTIILSLLGAGAIGLCAFILLEAILSRAPAANPGAILFRFQLSSMVAMAVFAGLAIVIYVWLARQGQNQRK